MSTQSLPTRRGRCAKSHPGTGRRPGQCRNDTLRFEQGPDHLPLLQVTSFPRWFWPRPVHGAWHSWRRSALCRRRVISPDIDETPLRDELPLRLCAGGSPERRLMRSRRRGGVRAGGGYRGGCRAPHPAEDGQTKQRSRRWLALLSGRRHRVLTSVVLRSSDGHSRERLVQSVVGVRAAERAAGRDYVASEEWRGKAGGYAIQGRRRRSSHSCRAATPMWSGYRCSRRRNCCAEPDWPCHEHAHSWRRAARVRHASRWCGMTN